MSIIREARDIVYVPPERFEVAKTVSNAEEIGRVKAQLKHRMELYSCGIDLMQAKMVSNSVDIWGTNHRRLADQRFAI